VHLTLLLREQPAAEMHSIMANMLENVPGLDALLSRLFWS